MTAGIFLALPLLAGPSAVFASAENQSLSVTIQMSKSAYAFDEPIDGQVVIESPFPAGVPVVFHIRLYRDKELQQTTVVSFDKIFSGKTKYPFQAMGIPSPPAVERSIGKWRLEIVQAGQEKSVLGKAEFRIVRKKP